MNKPLLAMTALLALSMDACPQPWSEKDPAEWTREDCQRFFRYSPWVHHEFQGSDPQVFVAVEDSYRADTSRRRVIVELFSALPVRQAHLRKASLGHFDFHTATAVQSRGLLPAEAMKITDNFDDHVVIRYIYDGDYIPGPERAWRPKGALLSHSALILADGQMILPDREVSLGKRSYQAEFPRYVDGKLIHELSGANLVFAVGGFSATASRVVRTYKFKIKDLMYQGQVEY